MYNSKADTTLQVIEGGHRSGRVATHQCCHGGTWYVMLEEEEIEKSLGMFQTAGGGIQGEDWEYKN